SSPRIALVAERAIWQHRSSVTPRTSSPEPSIAQHRTRDDADADRRAARTSQRAVSASQAVRELGSGAQGNEVNRSLKSVWFAAPPSMGLTLKISSTVRSVELWS